VSQERFASVTLGDAAAVVLLRETGWSVYRAVSPSGDSYALPESSGGYFAVRSDGVNIRGRSPVELVHKLADAIRLPWTPLDFAQTDLDRELLEAA
jgi:hypothetical protein